MPCTLTQAHDQILALLVAAWTFTGLPLQYPDMPPTGVKFPPAQGAWARATVEDGDDAGAVTLVGSITQRRYRTNGTIMVQVFAMSGDGRREAQRLGSIVLQAFRGKGTDGGVQFRNERVKDVGPSGTWYQVNAVVEYWYDTFETAQEASPGFYEPQIVGSGSFVQNQPLPFDGLGTHAVAVPLGAFAAADLIVIAVTNTRSLTEIIQTPTGWGTVSGMNWGTGGSKTDVFYRRMLSANEPGSVAFFGALLGVSTTWVARRWTWRNTDPSKVPVAAMLLPGASALRTLSGPALTTGWGPVKTGWMQYIGMDGQDSSAGATPAVTAFPNGYVDQATDTTNVAAPPYSLQLGCSQGACAKSEQAASQPAASWTFLPSIPGTIQQAFFAAIAVGGN